MDGRATSYKDPEFICGYEVIKRAGEARPLYTYLVRNPKNPEERAIAKYFDVHSVAGFGISKLEVMYFISDVLDFLDLGLLGTVRMKEGVLAETNNVCFDYAEGKTIYELVNDNETIGAQDAIAICKKIALVLSEAEREGFFHLALNPRNVFVSKEGGVTIKDWVLSEQNVALFAIPQRLEFDPYYFQPPELLDMKGVSAKTDIYSLGLLAAFMTSGDWKVKGAISGGISAAPEMRRTIHDFIAEDPKERIGDWKQAIELLGRGVTATGAQISGASEDVPQEEEKLKGEEETRLTEILKKEEDLEADSITATKTSTKVMPAPVKAIVAKQSESLFSKIRQRQSFKKTLAVALSAFVVLGIFGMVIAIKPFFQNNSTYTSRSDVMLLPSFVGMNFDDAQAKAQELGIILEKAEEHNKDSDAGIIMGQDPGADQEITEGMIEKLTVSLGPEDSAPQLGENVADAGTNSSSTDTNTRDSTSATTPAPTPASTPTPAPKPPGSKPVVSASASPSSGPSSGVFVTLSASAYDPDGGSIVSYSWSCGGSGASISREFTSSTAPKTITVAVTVTDEEGQTATASVSITLY